MSTNYSLPSLLVVVASVAFPLHISVSNQSFELPESVIEIKIDGKSIFNKPMMVEDQHNWEEIHEPSISQGKHNLFIHESKTGISKSMELTVDREQWIVIKFLSPKSGFVVDKEDQQVGYI